MVIYKPLPKQNDIKTVRKFLIFPMRVEDEIYWFEPVTIKYRYLQGLTDGYWMRYEIVRGWR